MFGRLTKQRSVMALAALIMLLAPYFFAFAGYAQTEPPPSGPVDQQDDTPNLSTGAEQASQPTATQYNETQAPLIQDLAEQSTEEVKTEVTQLLEGGDLGQPNDVYEAVKYWWTQDIISN